jgi:REP element-mobilizing transposase RayT
MVLQVPSSPCETLRRQIGGILRDLWCQQGVKILEDHAMPDHIHLCLSLPPKYSVAHTISFLKGKSATRIHRGFMRVASKRPTSSAVKIFTASPRTLYVRLTRFPDPSGGA